MQPEATSRALTGAEPCPLHIHTLQPSRQHLTHLEVGPVRRQRS